MTRPNADNIELEQVEPSRPAGADAAMPDPAEVAAQLAATLDPPPTTATYLGKPLDRVLAEGRARHEADAQRDAHWRRRFVQRLRLLVVGSALVSMCAGVVLMFVLRAPAWTVLPLMAAGALVAYLIAVRNWGILRGCVVSEAVQIGPLILIVSHSVLAVGSGPAMGPALGQFILLFTTIILFAVQGGVLGLIIDQDPRWQR